MKKKYLLSEIHKLDLLIKKPSIIYLKGNLGFGKTTLSKHIFNNILGIKEEITSPTYNYYNKYGNNYHFDLYKIDNYEQFVNIGGEEIFDNNDGVILVEWPEIIEDIYTPDILINIRKTDNENERELEFIYKS